MLRLALGLACCALLSAQPRIADCQIYPRDHAWNTPVDSLPVLRNSDALVASIGATRNLHPDFGRESGIPFNIVPADQPKVPVEFMEGKNESDPGPYPVPSNPKQEGGADGHILVLQQGECKLYELFLASPQGSGWKAYSGAIFDLNSNKLRPDGWTSSDAAGLAILPGLLRWDEIAEGEINHAIRFTVPRTRREYIWPARHFASSSNDPNLPAMGQRFRLKKSFDISRFSPELQVVLRAFKRYGIVVSDNGSPWFITGSDSPGWTDEFIAEFKTVPGTAFEAVDVSGLIVDPNSAQARIPSNLYQVPFASDVTFRAQLAPTQSLRLTGDVLNAVIDDFTDGQMVTFVICQDQSGGRSFRWPSNVRGATDIGMQPNRCSVQSFVGYNGNLLATGPGMQNIEAQ